VRKEANGLWNLKAATAVTAEDSFALGVVPCSLAENNRGNDYFLKVGTVL
jgi:hypothetical protein